MICERTGKHITCNHSQACPCFPRNGGANYARSLSNVSESAPYLFVQSSHWGMHAYSRRWDGSYPIEDYVKDYGLALYNDGPDRWR